ncbi:MAG: SUMF1/EgtB/PvdO family nonheme iron enzyme [Thermoanaerobaculia bacterium]
MRVFITSTPEELEPHRAAAVDVTCELGLEPVLREPDGGRDLPPVAACTRRVAASDRVLSLVGHRRGPVPPPELGGDGFHPWAWWETRAAFEHRLPVSVLMAADTWRPELREDDSRGGAVMRDFRGELQRLAVPFDDDGDAFRHLVRRQLVAALEQRPASPTSADVELRHWRPPTLPDHPYPVLLPYEHPDLMAGRDRELEELRQLLARPVPIVGVHAPSGTGKSSLLYCGLVQRLRLEGRPVAFDRHPCEPGLPGRLVADLVADELVLCDEDPHAFVARLLAVRQAADAPPLLVLDQLEDLLRRDGARRARAVVGLLLAASVQRQPGFAEPPCRWILAYRQEFHGKVVQWLADVLRDAQTLGLPAAATLPHDLAEAGRFQAWPLAPLGTPPPGSGDLASDAAGVFLETITRPLAHYPLRFAPGLAERLAWAFGEARARSPRSPLAPELQVLLAHLLAAADALAPDRARPTGEPVVIEMSEDPGELIEGALEEHLRRALDAAFPGGRHRLGRTRAVLALRELADASGGRITGLNADLLARAIGREGSEVLERLATTDTRVVVPQSRGDEHLYSLSHDRMAEVLVRLFEEGHFAALGVDEELLGLRRFVTLHSELHAIGEIAQAIRVPEARFQHIAANADALLWSGEQRRWFAACRERRRRQRRRRRWWLAAATLLVILITLSAWTLAARRAERRALRDEIVHGEPAAAAAACERLAATARAGDEELRALLGQRPNHYDVLERGVGGVAQEFRGLTVVRLAEIVLPLLEQAPENPVYVASLVWALDFFARGPDVAERARALREAALRELRRRRPPPPLPAAGDPQWSDIPAGTFLMGSGPGEGRDYKDLLTERPKHPVRLSPFRLMVHEVTGAEFRRLFPQVEGSGHPGPGHPGSGDPGAARSGSDELPATGMTWYQAYTYAAWLGGRLPTEAEWEYAARASCTYAYCRRDGSEATIDEVGWWRGNSVDPQTGEITPRPVMQLEPNPWGLYDVFGNVWEMNANWYYPYPQGIEVDPPGATVDPENHRTVRGGSAWDSAVRVAAPSRDVASPEGRYRSRGLRVALPGDLAIDDGSSGARGQAGSTTRQPRFTNPPSGSSPSR